MEWSKVKQIALERAQGVCEYCGDPGDLKAIPIGKDRWDWSEGNIKAYCEDCRDLVNKGRKSAYGRKYRAAKKIAAREQRDKQTGQLRMFE